MQLGRDVVKLRFERGRVSGVRFDQRSQLLQRDFQPSDPLFQFERFGGDLMGRSSIMPEG